MNFRCVVYVFVVRFVWEQEGVWWLSICCDFVWGPLLVDFCGRNVKFKTIVSCVCFFERTEGGLF